MVQLALRLVFSRETEFQKWRKRRYEATEGKARPILDRFVAEGGGNMSDARERLERDAKMDHDAAEETVTAYALLNPGAFKDD
jgi:hypothetical protein